MAVDWPSLEMLEARLNIDSDQNLHQDDLGQALEAGIAKVKQDIGEWDELLDEPDEALAQAALRMAELMAQRPFGVPPGQNTLDRDPTYRALMYGHRKSNFGVA